MKLTFTIDIRALSYLGRMIVLLTVHLSNTETPPSAVSRAARSFPPCTGNALYFPFESAQKDFRDAAWKLFTSAFMSFTHVMTELDSLSGVTFNMPALHKSYFITFQDRGPREISLVDLRGS